MISIKVNDIIDELFDENKRLLNELLFAKKCLNVLNQLKTHLNLCFNQLTTNLCSKDLQIFVDLDNEYKDVMNQKPKYFTENIELKCEQNIDLNQINPNLSENVCKTSDESIDSKTIKQNNKHLNEKLAKLKPKIELKFNPNIRKTSKGKHWNKCPNIECNKTFKTRTAVKIHYKSIHSLVKEEIVCDFIGCGQTFKTIHSLRSHSILHSSEGKQFSCDFDGCDYRCIRRDDLIAHINVHLGVRPFRCSHGLCDKTFTAEKHLKFHVKNIHPIERRFKCQFSECNKIFKNKNGLYIHSETHRQDRPYICSEPNCQFRTKVLKSLKAHKSKHSTERRYVCPVFGCGKTYKHMCGLKDHTQSSHTTDRLFKCQFEGCDKTYKTEALLGKHKWIHTSRVLSCDWPGCDYSSKLAKNLRQHKLVHSCDRRHGCDWPECGKRFKSRHHLKIHLRIHNNDKRFLCHWPGCQYKCTTSGNLKLHLKVHQKSS